MKINASKPFMLAFAESYDPLWVARVDKIDGRPVQSETIRPVPLYSVMHEKLRFSARTKMEHFWRSRERSSRACQKPERFLCINGFYVNNTGNLDITIEYEPQKWFYVGAAISATTLVASVGYLVYEWRRDRKNEILPIKRKAAWGGK